MSQPWIAVLLLVSSLLSGCSVLQGGKLLAPERFGLTPVAPNIYMEAGADETARGNLRKTMARAEDAIRVAYGSVISRPTVHACLTEKCYEAFGGRGSVAKVYGKRILLSPRGLNWHFLVASNIPRPIREELHTFKSLRQWLDAVHRYGEDKNAERKAKGEPEIRPVYSAAGHELRPWLANVGSPGLIAFIARMNDGEDFESAYQMANSAGEK